MPSNMAQTKPEAVLDSEVVDADPPVNPGRLREWGRNASQRQEDNGSVASSEFGPFAAAVPGYLELLNLDPNSNGAQIVIDQIRDALAVSDAQRWVSALLTDPGWRLHLVAAVAFLLDQPKALDCAPLWSAIDAGSWVTPQLVVTALFSDPAFPTRARDRVEGLCPVTSPSTLTPIVRHVLTGPGEAHDRSAKMLASILSVCSVVPSLAAREASWRAKTEIQALLDADAFRDRSQLITSHWMSATSAAFLKRGIVLTPASV